MLKCQREAGNACLVVSLPTTALMSDTGAALAQTSNGEDSF